ncbi:MAG: hypothetical protein ACXWJG_17670 [Caldimonas sp.]
MNAKKLAIVSMALAGVLAAASVEAHGRDDVRFSVTIGSPGWSQPAPVYVPVARSYDRHDEGSYRHAPTRWDRDGDGIPNRYDRHDDTRHDRDGRGASRR